MGHMKWWAVAAAVCVGGSSANAFYWPDWPSSPGARIERTLLPQGQSSPGTPVANPKFPNGDLGFPDLPVAPPLPPPPPGHVPEPASGVAGLIGLGVLAAAKWRRRKV